MHSLNVDLDQTRLVWDVNLLTCYLFPCILNRFLKGEEAPATAATNLVSKRGAAIPATS